MNPRRPAGRHLVLLLAVCLAAAGVLSAEPVRSGGEGPLVRGEESGVDRSGRDAGEDRHPEVGTPFSQEPQDADLIGGARPTAGEDQREIATHGATLAKAAIG